MKMRLFILGIIVLSLIFVSCDNGTGGGGNDGNPFIGTWVTRDATEQQIITFNRDGTGTFTIGNQTATFRYEVSNNTVTITELLSSNFENDDDINVGEPITLKEFQKFYVKQ